MSSTIIVHDMKLTGKIYNQTKLVLQERQITLEELIKERVLQEVASHNTFSLGKAFPGLVQPVVEDSSTIDAKKQVAIALKGFQENRFFVMVNDKQISSLSELLTIENDTRISFLKLVLLIGG